MTTADDTDRALAAERADHASVVAGLQAALTAAQAEVSALKVAATTPAGWAPLWAEEFDGNSVDPSKWNVRKEALKTDQSYNQPANVTVANSVLSITAKKESVGGRAYTSGYLDTIGKFSLPATDFRVECRAKVPLQLGMWAAPLWLRPDDGGAGEIDLVETYGGKPTAAFQTLHTAYATDQMAHGQVPWSKLKNPDPLDWHTYVVEKTKGSVKVWVDEVLSSWSPALSSYAPLAATYDAGKTWNLRVCLQVGAGASGAGKSAGDPSTAATDWTKTTMQLDYIRAFKKVGS